MSSHTYKNLNILGLVWFTYLIWININYRPRAFSNYAFDNLNTRENDTKTGALNTSDWRSEYNEKMSYILVWPKKKWYPFSKISEGQEEFIRLKCPILNCYVTSNTSFFDDIRKFDVVALMGVVLSKENLPKQRVRHQKFIYFNIESSVNYPVEDDIFDKFFNGMATYRLDSHIPLPYLLVRDIEGNVVGPKHNIHWRPQGEYDAAVYHSILKYKSRAAAIFYSHCKSESERHVLIAQLKKELKYLGFTIDVYGPCGSSKHSNNFNNYIKMLEKGYYFYLSYESTLDKDFVTHQLLTPLQNNIVPVVYGGANYSRFLPPKSYLDATNMTTWELAKTMVHLIKFPRKYLQYFWWKKYYTYHDPKERENICNLCAIVNSKRLWKAKKTIKKFRKWWNVYGYG